MLSTVATNVLRSDDRFWLAAGTQPAPANAASTSAADPSNTTFVTSASTPLVIVLRSGSPRTISSSRGVGSNLPHPRPFAGRSTSDSGMSTTSVISTPGPYAISRE